MPHPLPHAVGPDDPGPGKRWALEADLTRVGIMTSHPDIRGFRPETGEYLLSKELWYRLIGKSREYKNAGR
jgi:hypothetical protein